MRLWHYKLIPYLPRTQLIAQWRELNSIFKKQDKHILINYIYDYHSGVLLNYTLSVIGEMICRGYNINKWDNFDNYFHMSGEMIVKLNSVEKLKYFGHLEPYLKHNNRYLLQCFFNLQEKYDAGQKDFKESVYVDLYRFMQEEIPQSNEILELYS